MKGDNIINKSITTCRIEVFDKIITGSIDNNSFQNLKHAESFQFESNNNYMQYWMQKNVNKHDVSIQVNEDEETSICQSYQSNYLKSTNHLNAIIAAIELSKNNTQINPKNDIKNITN